MSSNYWRKREEKHIKQKINDDKIIVNAIEQRLQLALDSVQKEIAANFANYSDKEDITLAETHERVSKMDIEAFKRKAKEYVKTKDFSPEANYQLKIYNLTMRVSRLELLKSQIGLELVVMSNDLDKYFKFILTDEGLTEMQRQAGILGETVFKDHEKAIKEIVNASFNTATFSQRIWQYQTELKVELDRLLVRQITQGKNPRLIARYLKDSFNVTKVQTERLMRTESARIQTAIQAKSYDKYGVKKYEYIAEPTACKICRSLNGKIINVKNMQIGKNACPMHANCRCSTMPYIKHK